MGHLPIIPRMESQISSCLSNICPCLHLLSHSCPPNPCLKQSCSYRTALHSITPPPRDTARTHVYCQDCLIELLLPPSSEPRTCRVCTRQLCPICLRPCLATWFPMLPYFPYSDHSGHMSLESLSDLLCVPSEVPSQSLSGIYTGCLQVPPPLLQTSKVS